MSRRRLNPIRMLKWRLPARIDVRRAAFAFSGVTSVLALALIFAIHAPTKNHVQHGFGWEWRTGSILFMPFAGDDCQHSVFDNDSGVIWPAGSISCMEITGEAEKIANASAVSSHVATISQNFRK